MENTLASVILPLKKIAKEHFLSAQRIYDMIEAGGDHVSLNTIKKLLAPGSENQSFNYYQSIEPISRVLYALEEEKHESEKDRIIAEQAEKIRELKNKAAKKQKPAKKTKTKYTLRSDGRIVLTKIIEGERKSFYGRSDEEVEAKRDAYIAELAKQPKEKVPTFGEVADLYWEKKEPTISPNSLSSYTSRLKEAKEEFGDMPINEIEQWQILDYLQRIAAQGYAQKGVSNRRSIIKSIFDFAVSQKDIPLKANPCISMPAVIGKKGKKRRPASDQDVEQIEAHKNDSLMAKLYYFMEYTGCRIGEAAVLQQKHIDLEHHKAVIVQDIAFRGQTPEVKLRPKTEAGVREIDLYDNVIEILPRYDDPETFIFFPDGLPTRSGLATAQKHYRQEAGISATAHQLRHTYAGIMHSAEIDVKDTQARLGHANISTTQDIYTEIEKQHNEKQRNKANAYIMGERLKRPVASCPKCGSAYTAAPDGHAFTFCPDCGKKLIRKA